MTLHKVGVIGFPIDHSLSPVMHNAAFQALGMTDWLYDKIAIPPDIIKLSLRELRDHGYVGINVTIPHKQAVMPYVKADATAQAIGAVNTIDFRTNVGTNTDVIGLMDDLTAHDIKVAGEKVIVLGAGGAARAAVYGLANAGSSVILVNRTADKAQALIEALGVAGQVMTADEAFAAGARIMINCTPVGMHPHTDESPLETVPPGVTLYDMIYRPAVTRLMDQVTAAGGRAVGGLGMLVRQGAAAFHLWTGVYPPVDVMRRAAEEALKERKESA
ncbi:MAG: shikimate dehydrogenase [Anaerolinea sp.]|nr:shikimate dehydrogenase [Anaerolinea sp.]